MHAAVRTRIHKHFLRAFRLIFSWRLCTFGSWVHQLGHIILVRLIVLYQQTETSSGLALPALERMFASFFFLSFLFFLLSLPLFTFFLFFFFFLFEGIYYTIQWMCSWRYLVENDTGW